MRDEDKDEDKDPELSEYFEGREEANKLYCIVCGSEDIRPYLLGGLSVKRCGKCGAELCPHCLYRLKQHTLPSAKKEWYCPRNHPLK